jgi:hypothetical protein
MIMMVMMMMIKCDQERSQKYFKTQRSYKTNTLHVKCQNESDTSTNRGNGNFLKITSKIPEQRTGEDEMKELGTAHILGKHEMKELGTAHILGKMK